MLTASRLISERGWTHSLIKKYLGAPDTTKRNPYYRSAAPMKLYALGRIIEAESADDFQKALARAEKRRQTAKSIAQEKREELITWASSLPDPKLPNIDKDKLTRRAVLHYNNLWSQRGDFTRFATVTDDEEFLNRITVNYVRHELTGYENRIQEMHGKIGKFEAYRVIRVKILTDIASRYGWLAAECIRQQKAHTF